MEDYLRVGDTVNIFWDNVPNIANAVILHVPEEYGDSYIARDAGGHLHLIGYYARITRLAKKKESAPQQTMEQLVTKIRNPEIYGKDDG